MRIVNQTVMFAPTESAVTSLATVLTGISTTPIALAAMKEEQSQNAMHDPKEYVRKLVKKMSNWHYPTDVARDVNPKRHASRSLSIGRAMFRRLSFHRRASTAEHCLDEAYETEDAYEIQKRMMQDQPPPNPLSRWSLFDKPVETWSEQQPTMYSHLNRLVSSELLNPTPGIFRIESGPYMFNPKKDVPLDSTEERLRVATWIKRMVKRNPTLSARDVLKLDAAICKDLQESCPTAYISADDIEKGLRNHSETIQQFRNAPENEVFQATEEGMTIRVGAPAAELVKGLSQSLANVGARNQPRLDFSSVFLNPVLEALCSLDDISLTNFEMAFRQLHVNAQQNLVWLVDRLMKIAAAHIAQTNNKGMMNLKNILLAGFALTVADPATTNVLRLAGPNAVCTPAVLVIVGFRICVGLSYCLTKRWLSPDKVTRTAKELLSYNQKHLVAVAAKG